MSKSTSIISLFLIFLGITLPAAEPNWPQWRGPNRDGISTESGLLKSWPEGGPKLEWSNKGLGSGFASVAIHEGQIFTMGNRKDGQFLIALSLADGSEQWATKVSGAENNGSRSTPTVDGNLVFTLSSSGDLICCETKSGKEVWKKNFARDFGGKMMSGWGYCESPLVDGEHLICTPGSNSAAMAALNKLTGDVVWKCETPNLGRSGKDGAGYSSIVISEACGIRQYVQLLGRGVIGVSAADGKFLWNYNRIANGTANIPTPIIRDEFVFCSTGYQTGAALLKLVKDGSGVKAEEVYFHNGNTLQNHHGGMLLVGDYLYGGHGHNNGLPVCVKFSTGEIMWGPERGPGTGSAAVVYADGRLYFRYQNGVMALIEASPKGLNLLGTFNIPEARQPSWQHPVVAGGKLYLREQDHLHCYRLTQ